MRRAPYACNLVLALISATGIPASAASLSNMHAHVRPAPATLQPEVLRARLDDTVARAEAAGFSGVLLVADHNTIVYEASVGLADRTTQRWNSPATRFNLASTGKLFTIVAVLQLVEQGKLDLEAPLARYLPDWPQPAVRDRVTVRHLLTHTAGLGDFFANAEFARSRTHLDTVAAHMPLLHPDLPRFVPGSDFAYSNSGYMLLGRLIEIASGEDYFDYVQDHVFTPAGMHDSGYYDAAHDTGMVAQTYFPADDGRIVSDHFTQGWRGSPAGGGFSTARDLLHFHRALVQGVLLPPEAMDLFFQPIPLPGAGARRGWGLGPVLRRVDQDMLYGHPGGAPGTAVEFWALRERGLAVVMLSNYAPILRKGVVDPPTVMIDGVYEAIVAAGGPALGDALRRRSR